MCGHLLMRSQASCERASYAYFMWMVANKKGRSTIPGQLTLQKMIYYGNKNLKFHIPSEGQTY